MLITVDFVRLFENDKEHITQATLDVSTLKIIDTVEEAGVNLGECEDAYVTYQGEDFSVGMTDEGHFTVIEDEADDLKALTS